MAHKAEPGGREAIAKLSQSKELQAYFATLGKPLDYSPREDLPPSNHSLQSDSV